LTANAIGAIISLYFQELEDKARLYRWM